MSWVYTLEEMEKGYKAYVEPHKTESERERELEFDCENIFR